MNKDKIKEKFLQSFIIGYQNTIPSDKFWDTISSGLGGIIFFAENLQNRSDFKNLISKFKKNSKIPLFLSIDQEGGLVERTIFLDEKIEYLTPKALSNISDIEIFKKHYEILSEDLVDLGINMNFSPVLDVNSNPKNPIIGVRSFGDNVGTVNKYSKHVIDVFKKYNIISCGKHFAGHGNTETDSHKNMPFVKSEFTEFYNNHLICFEEAIKNDVDTMMISHVHFSFFDKEKIPCSISKNGIDYLKNQLHFKGLILSDDMVMGGISGQYGLKESILLALKAGIEVMLFKNLTDELLTAIEDIAETATKDENLKSIILNNYEKIIDFKKEKIKPQKNIQFDIKEAQKTINNIATKTVVINKKGILPINKNQNIKIISFDKQDIYNLSSREKDLSDFLKDYNIEEINYYINMEQADIERITNRITPEDVIIFISYNAQIDKSQLKLFNSINNPKILVSCGLDYDISLMTDSESIISLSCGKTSSLKALAEILTKK